MTRTQLINEIVENIRKNTKLTTSQIAELQDAFQTYPMEYLEKIHKDDFQYFECHTHTNYSLLDGVNKITEYINKAKELGHPRLITDHRVTHVGLKSSVP